MARDVLAARLIEHGEPLVVEEVALADPGPGEVVIELAYAGVNPVDRYGALGRVAPGGPLPRTLGTEAAGTVGGRRVIAHGHGIGTARDGLWANAAVVPEEALVEVPDGVDLREAAAASIAGATAWRTVTDIARVQASDRVLVLGATGGTGTMIVSLAHSIGATVWGQTSDSSKSAWVRERGADAAVVVSNPADLPAKVRELEPTVVFDSLGDGFTGAAIESMAVSGRVALFGTSAGPVGELPLQVLYRNSITVRGYGGLNEPEEKLKAAKTEALRAMADGRMQVVVDRVLPVEEVNESLSLIEHRKVLGKLVLDVRAKRAPDGRSRRDC